MKKTLIYATIAGVALVSCKKDDKDDGGNTGGGTIEITMDDAPKAGDSFEMRQDTMPSSSISTGSSGLNGAYDFSNLVEHVEYEVNFKDVPANNPIPEANIIMEQVTDGIPFPFYMKKTSNSLEFHGTALTTPIPGLDLGNAVLVAEDPMTMFQFPMEYGTKMEDDFKFSFKFPFDTTFAAFSLDLDSLEVIIQGTLTLDCDGEGELNKGGSKVTALRVIQEIQSEQKLMGYVNGAGWQDMTLFIALLEQTMGISIDDIFGALSDSKSYSYLTKDHAIPTVDAGVDASDKVTEVTFVK